MNGTGSTTSAPEGRHRHALYAIVRALVVLLVAVVVYQAVVPTTHVVRSRLARLVAVRSGVAAFDKSKPQAGEQKDTGTGLAAVTAAAKKSPGGTGIYSIEWSPTSTSGAGIIAFLLPDAPSAAKALGQIRTQQLGPGSYSSDSLTRTATFSVAGVPASSGSIYQSSAKTGGLPNLAVTAFQDGRVVAVSEVASTGSTARSDAATVTATEYAQLRKVAAGFTLSKTETPLVATILWAVGAVVLAALAALIPVERRRRARKRQLAYEAEMANKVVVGRRVIAKHRR